MRMFSVKLNVIKIERQLLFLGRRVFTRIFSHHVDKVQTESGLDERVFVSSAKCQCFLTS